MTERSTPWVAPWCECGHADFWHGSDLERCEFHCGNPERCPCRGFRDPGATHYYGDGCDAPHGRPDAHGSYHHDDLVDDDLHFHGGVPCRDGNHD